MSHFLKPTNLETNWLIKSASPQPRGAKATVINSGTGAIASSAYTGFKHVARVYGFYKDIQPYLPETTIDRYRYKVHKRTSGYVGQKIHKSKTSTGYNQLRETRGKRIGFSNFNQCRQTSSKSGYCYQ